MSEGEISTPTLADDMDKGTAHTEAIVIAAVFLVALTVVLFKCLKKKRGAVDPEDTIAKSPAKNAKKTPEQIKIDKKVKPYEQYNEHFDLKRSPQPSQTAASDSSASVDAAPPPETTSFPGMDKDIPASVQPSDPSELFPSDPVAIAERLKKSHHSDARRFSEPVAPTQGSEKGKRRASEPPISLGGPEIAKPLVLVEDDKDKGKAPQLPQSPRQSVTKLMSDLPHL